MHFLRLYFFAMADTRTMADDGGQWRTPERWRTMADTRTMVDDGGHQNDGGQWKFGGGEGGREQKNGQYFFRKFPQSISQKLLYAHFRTCFTLISGKSAVFNKLSKAAHFRFSKLCKAYLTTLTKKKSGYKIPLKSYRLRSALHTGRSLISQTRCAKRAYRTRSTLKICGG